MVPCRYVRYRSRSDGTPPNDRSKSPIDETKEKKLYPRATKGYGQGDQKLIDAGFIKVSYPKWMANVLVKKANEKWRCIDFTNLNKACLKNNYTLLRIDQLVNATVGHELLSFMDAFSGYNQIRTVPEDEKKTLSLLTRLFCYSMMTFGLKNVGATSAIGE